MEQGPTVICTLHKLTIAAFFSPEQLTILTDTILVHELRKELKSTQLIISEMLKYCA